MGKSDSKRYRIRNRLHEIESSITEEEILRRIASGKYSGDEEVALSSGRWEKLTTHPRFYDAFLNRIFEDQYVPPAGSFSFEPRSGDPLFEKERKTKDIDYSPTTSEKRGVPQEKSGEEESNKTSKIGQERVKDFGLTIHQSAIDELFSNPSVGKSGKELHEKQPDLVDPDGVDFPAHREPLGQTLDISSGPKEEEDAEYLKRKRRRDRRRKFSLILGLVTGLFILFQLGKSEKVDPSKAAGESQNLGPAVKQLVTDSATKEEKVQSLIEEGDRLYENDTLLFYQGARELFNEALSYDDNNPAILGRVSETIARLLQDGGQSEGLEDAIAKVIEKGRTQDPQFSQFYRAEALVWLYKGKWDAARKAVEAAVESDPSNTENSLTFGEIQFEAGDLQKAKDSFDEVLKANAFNIRARHHLALIAFAQHDLKESRAQAMETLRLNPLHAPSYHLLARVFDEMNRSKESEQLYETAGKLASFASKKELGEVFFRLAALEELAEERTRAQSSYRLSFFYAPELKKKVSPKLVGLDTSYDSLRKLASENQFLPSYFKEQAESLIRQSKPKESLVFLQAAYLLEPNSGNALLRLGEVTEKLANSYDDFRTVVSFYQRAIERDPGLTEAYIKLGLLETDQYNLDRGYRLLKQAEALSPKDAAVYVALGKHFYKANDYLAAVEEFTRAYKLNPSDPEILYYAGLLRLLGKKEGEKEALNLFYRSYMLNPLNYDALVEWLKLKVQTYEKNFAIKFVRNLMEQDGQNANLYWALGEIYAANKEYQRSINYFHNALDLDNRSSKIRMSLGKSLESVGELDKAIAEYRLASLLDRRNGEGFYRAADLLFQLKNYSESEEVLKYLVSVTPNYPGAHRYLSKIYQMRKQKDFAVSEMRKEVANNPQNAKFRIELSELLMEYEKYDEAIVELSEITNLPSVEKAPAYVYEKIRSYLLLARCYRAQGKLENAEGSIQLALQTDPNDPELHRELGYIYAALQRDKEALKAFNFYLDRSPAAKDADSIKLMIQQLKIEE